MARRLVFMVTIIFMALSSPLWAQTVTCVGTESGGDGQSSCGTTLRYAYEVDPQGNMLTLFLLGTEDGDSANYKNICLPPGWRFGIAVNNNPDTMPHSQIKTPHGEIAPPANGGCPYVISFLAAPGPPITTPFVFGFNHTSESHTVRWVLAGPGQSWFANWSQPVGMSLGPVHTPAGPGSGGASLPGLTGWGVLALVVLLILAGGYVLHRRFAKV